MSQIRIAKRRLRSPSGQQEPLPLDPRDPNIVRAHRAARRAVGTRAGGRARTGPGSGDR